MDKRFASAYRYDRMYSTRKPFESSPSFFNGEKKEIASKVVFLESKKFYIDLIKSMHGKLVKITEVSLTGQKFKLVVRMETAADILEQIIQFSEHANQLDKKKLVIQNEPLKTCRLFSENRKYYLDLLNYNSGLFLKIAAKSNSRDNTQILIPGHCLESFIQAMQEVMGIALSKGDSDTAKTDDDTQMTQATVGDSGDGSDRDEQVVFKRNSHVSREPDNRANNIIADENGCLEWQGGKLTIDKVSSQQYITITQEEASECTGSIRVPVEACRSLAYVVLDWASSMKH